MLYLNKNYELSKEMFLLLLDQQKIKYGEKDISVGQTMNNVGTVLSENGEFQLAEKYIKEAIDILENDPNITVGNIEKIKKNLKII